MIRAFFLSIGQLGDPAIVRVLMKSILITLLVFVALGVGLWFAADSWLAEWDADWAGPLAGIGAVIGTILLGWLLFQVVAVAVIQLYVDDIVVAVERRHYPQALAGARRVTMLRALGFGLRSAARALLVNVVLLPVYLVLLVTGIGTLAVFLIANGWVLGQDFSEMVAARHISGATMRDWRRNGRGERWVMGTGIMALFLVPLANLFAPVLGAAMATHLFHGRETR